MKGYLHKTEKGWFVIYDQILGEGIVKKNQNALPLHPLDIKQIDEDDKVFDNIEARIKEYPDVEFKIETKLVFDKISLSSIQVPVYAKLISTDSKKDRTCNHTNCREICPECKLPSDILKNVISSQPDWNGEPLNSFGEDFGKDCESVKNWDSFVEKKNNELEVDKLADIFLKEEWQKDDDQVKFGIKVGFVEGYNKSKENYEVVSSVRELYQYKLGLEDGYNNAKKTFYTEEEVLWMVLNNPYKFEDNIKEWFELFKKK